MSHNSCAGRYRSSSVLSLRKSYGRHLQILVHFGCTDRDGLGTLTSCKSADAVWLLGGIQRSPGYEPRKVQGRPFLDGDFPHSIARRFKLNIYRLWPSLLKSCQLDHRFSVCFQAVIKFQFDGASLPWNRYRKCRQKMSWQKAQILLLTKLSQRTHCCPQHTASGG